MLSNFGAAHFPEVESLRDFRAYLAASDVPVPDELSQASTGDAIFLRDIYLGAVLTWTLLTGLEPPVVASALGVNESALSSAPISDALKVWFGKALSCNRETRFSSMEDAFAAFIAATDDTDLRLGQRRLDPFRTDDEPHFTYPPRTKADVIKQGNAHIWLHSGSDAGSLVIKTWPHRGTRPEDRLHAILAFFDRVNLLRTSAVPWAPEVVDFGLTETCIFIAERFIDAHDLNQIQDEWLAPHQVAEIVLALIDAVGSLHQLGLTHGDLKPEHVKVGTRDGKFVVILIDLHDYSGDERRASNIAYSAPLDNADWETHDRFAVCKIVERLCERISQGNDGCRLDVLSAVARCGDEDHSWRTLAPLALEAAKFQSVTARPRIELRVAGSKKAELLQPNGDVIYLVRQPEGVVTFVGSNRQIQMNLASDSEITTSRATTATLQWAMRSGEQLQVDVLIRPAAKSDLSDARKFIESLDPRQAELPAPDLAETAPLLREGALAPRASALSKSGIDVRHLWNEIIKIEMEQRPSVIVAAAPVFDQALGLHLIPCGDVDVSEFDFGGADVSIKKNDKQVAILDPFATQPGFLAARELKRADSVRVNDRLTLESVLESEDLRRRSTAVARVLSDNAVIPKLIDYFDPDSGALPVPFYRNSPGSDDLEQYCLNDGQKRAFQLLWQRRPLGLLQGPPGTGKTDFIAAFVHYAVTKANLRNVLVLSQSHEAANAVTSRIKRIGLEQKNPASMLRFGLIEKLSEDLLPIHAGAIQSGYREDFVTTLPLRIVEFSQRLGISRDYARKAFELERDIRALMRSPRLIDVASTTLVGDIDVPALIALLERFAVRGSTLLGQLKHALHDALADQLRVTNPAGVAAYRHLLELSWNWDAALRGHGRTLESFLAQSRSVVCGTCVGAGKKNLGIDAHVYDLVVVDEAARCGPGELAVAIQSAAWVILVGDHKQLPPVIDGDIVDELRARLAVSEVALLASDFERVFQSKYGLAASATLTTQYRMAPTIRALVAAHFYQEEGLEDGRGDPPEYYKLLSEPFGAPVTWYDTADLGEDAREHKVGDSYNNAMEARIIVDLLQRISKRRSFWAAADAGTSIGVICMYAEQRRLVREYVQGSELPSEFRRRVKIDTVDGYQGQQNDIIIVSLVRNNPFGKVGFARDKRRANVALSRARERLLLVGSAACFESSPADDNALCRMPDYLRTLAGFGNRVLRATLPDIGNG
jgi:hypothetical protein